MVQFVIAGGLAGLGMALSEATFSYGIRLARTLWQMGMLKYRESLPAWEFEETVWLRAAASLVLTFLAALIALAGGVGGRSRRRVVMVFACLITLGLCILIHAALWNYFALRFDWTGAPVFEQWSRKAVNNRGVGVVQAVSFVGNVALLLVALFVAKSERGSPDPH